MSFLKSLTITAAFLLAAGSLTQAQLLNFELNGGPLSSPQGDQSYSGAAAIGSPGDIWNHVYLSDVDILSQTSGFVFADNTAATGITITGLSNWNLTGRVNSYDIGGLLQSYMGVNTSIPNGTPSTLTLSGFNPGAVFDLYVIATSGHAGVGGIFSVNGSPTQELNGITGVSYALGVDTLLFSGVVADMNGNINISETTNAANSDYRVLNGLQLQAVPEPGTYGLIAGAVVILLSTRVFRKKAANICA